MKLSGNKFQDQGTVPFSIRRIFLLVLAGHIFFLTLGLLLTSEREGTKAISQVPGTEPTAPQPTITVTPSPKTIPRTAATKPPVKTDSKAQTDKKVKTKTTVKIKKPVEAPTPDLSSDLKKRLEKRLSEE